MKNLVKYTQHTNALNGLWKNGDTIIVGVSGGPDSMCLLDVMAHIAQKECLRVIVAHVNYGLRGDDSLKDQELVQSVAQQHGFVCEIKVCDSDLDGNENLWRNMRYDFFEKLQKKHAADAIAVAHTKNDQAETLLLHLLRGSGLAGLTGMQLKSTQGVIRPFLAVKRADVMKYCAENTIVFHSDKTNEDNTFTRNRIRNELLPYLQKNYNAQIIDVLANATTTTSDDYEALMACVDIFWTYDRSKNEIFFRADKFVQQHISIQRLSVRKMLVQLCGTMKDIEKGFVDEVCKMISSNKGKIQKMEGKDLKIVKKGDKVEIAYHEEV